MKKNLILFLLVMCLWVSVFGFEKGTKSIGGSISLSNTKYNAEQPSYSTFAFSPNFSYFIADNLSLDLSPSYFYSWGENSVDYSSFSLGLGASYYINKFYLSGSFLYMKSGAPGSKTSSQYLRFAVGHLFAIAQNIHLNTGMVYERGLGKSKYEEMSSDNDMSSIKGQVGISIFFK